jgi:hypothetical protein
MSKINLIDFGVVSNEIPLAVEEVLSKMSSLQKAKLDKSYGSAIDFLQVLFHLHFTEHLLVSQIADKLNLKPQNIKKHLYNFAWDYSQEYEENKRLQENQNQKNPQVLLEAKNSNLDVDEYVDLKKVLAVAKDVRPKAYLKMKFETSEEMARVLYYLVRVKNMSRKGIASLFGMNIDTMRLRLKSLGLLVDYKEGIRLKKMRGSQNYDKTNLSGKKARLNSQISQISTGSKNEDILRKRLSLIIYEYMPENCEWVVGLSNTGVLGHGKEIDIPIVVYNRSTQKIFRFAIEYNGDYYHDKQRDIEKKSLCENIGWVYLPVIESVSNQLSNNSSLIEKEARNLCEEIRKIVNAAKA